MKQFTSLRSVKTLSLVAILCCCAVLFSACVKNNPEPVWLSIDSWVLNENPDPGLEEGDLSHNFTDVRVYVDNKIIGIFEVPCKIPVLISGSAKEIVLSPVIRNNGISATKKVYPFCEPFKVTLDLVEGQTYDLHPTTQYYSACKFKINDKFDISTDLNTDPNSNASLEIENDPEIAKWDGYGHISLNAGSDSLWLGYTQKYLNLPKAGAEVYLEVDYMTSNNLLTGVFAISSASGAVQNPNIQINPQSAPHWNKIYIDLKEIVSNSNSADYFEMYFRALIDEGESSGDIYLDNFKVIHF